MRLSRCFTEKHFASSFTLTPYAGVSYLKFGFIPFMT